MTIPPSETTIFWLYCHYDIYPAGTPLTVQLKVDYGDAYYAMAPQNKVPLEVTYYAPPFECDDDIRARVWWPGDEFKSKHIHIFVREMGPA
jgi:hypothetical protein